MDGFKSQTSILIPATILMLWVPSLALGQSIVPAQDGVGTQVILQGNQYNIEGGKLSGDGSNLFHSFEKLGLSEGEILNFISQPEIQNILGRVTGGEASFINGLIQLSGGNANLFLMNPAGIIFGENASLNVPASFTATTANGIGLGQKNWFNAVGEANWNGLVGTPQAFVFSTATPGSLVNLGRLAVPAGENLTLLVGTVLNTGSLIAPGGEITVASVRGENLVRISQTGHLLSLEITPILPNPIPSQGNHITPLSIPQLLTGGNGGSATRVEVNQAGEVVLTQSGVRVPTTPGTTILAGNLTTENLATQGIGGTVNVLGDRIGLFNTNINVSGMMGGGNVRIGGEYKGLGTIPNAQQTLISSDSQILADALQRGNGGRVIIWSEKTTQSYGQIRVRGGIEGGNGGFVETSSRGFLDITQSPDISAPAGKGGTWLIDPNNIEIVDDAEPSNITDTSSNPTTFTTTADTARLPVSLLKTALQKGDVTVETGTAEANLEEGNITFRTSFDFDGILQERTLTLNAANNIDLGQKNIFDSNPVDGDALNLVLNADFDQVNGGIVNIFNSQLNTQGGDLIAVGQNIAINQSTINTEGGNLNFTGSFNLSQSTINSTGGDIIVTSQGTPTSPTAITLIDGKMDAAGGNINLTGTAVDGIGENHGIVLLNSALATETDGEIILSGTAGVDSDSNFGIWINKSTISGEDGEINLTGVSQGNLVNNQGILITQGSTIETTGQGSIALQGTSGTGQNNYGIHHTNNSSILTVDGDIRLTGIANGDSFVNGTVINNSIISSSGKGEITIAATSNGTGDNNDGVSIINSGQVLAKADGDITLFGLSGEGNASEGILVFQGGVIQSQNGNIEMNGNSRGRVAGHGILINQSRVETIDSGNIFVEGTAQGLVNNNDGIVLVGNSTVAANTTGNITVTGTSSSAAGSQGIILQDGSLITTSAGTLTLSGISNGIESSGGIVLNNSRLQTTTSGDINLTGISNGTGNNTNGVVFLNNVEVAAAGTGNLAIEGTSGTDENSSGIRSFNSQLRTEAGSITLTGTTPTPNSSSIFLNENTVLEITGQNAITLAANENISTGSIVNPGGAINLTSLNGNIDMSSASIDSSSTLTNGGNVTVDAGGFLRLGNINTSTTAVGTTAGTLILNSNNPIVLAGDIDTSAINGSGGNVEMTADLLLTQPTTTITTTGSNSSGNINFTNLVDGSNPGSNTLILNAATGDVSFQNPVGNTTALQRLQIQAANVSSNGSITVENGDINIDAANTVNLQQPLTVINDGSVEITANSDITTNSITTSGQPINLVSVNGSINTTAGTLNSSSNSNNGGEITLNAATTLSVGNLNSSTNSSSSSSQAGTINLNSGNNEITLTGDIDVSATRGQGSDLNFDTNLKLGQDSVTLTTTGNNRSGNVTFNNPINGTTAGETQLIINAGKGNVDLNAAVGNQTPLNGLTITANIINSIDNINVATEGVNITAAGSVNLAEPVTANAGSVEITADNNITTNTITTSGQPINLISNNGSIDTTAGTLNTRSTNGNGGNINIDAANTLNVGNLDSRTTSSSSNSQGGRINLSSGSNLITLEGEQINTSATNGQGSDLTFNHDVQLTQTTTTLTTSGNNGSGNVTFNNSVNGTTAGENSLIINAGEGNVNLNAAVGDVTPLNGLTITGENINSNNPIAVETEGVNITATGDVNLQNEITANEGSVEITAANDITTNTITTSGQPINLVSENGRINTTAGTLDSRSNNNSANEGSVEITAANDITTNTITTSGQPINLVSENGSINTTAGILDSRSDNNSGGEINLDAATNLNIGNLNSSTTSNSPDSQAGTINLNAGNNNNTITLAGDIDTSATTGQGSDLNFNHSVQLTQPTTTLTTSGNNNSGNITFNNPINGTAAGENSLILNAGESNVNLNAAVGDITPLNGLTITANTINSIDNINVETEGVNLTATGSVNLQNDITANAGSVEITAANDITTNTITTSGQPINLVSENGRINTTAGTLDSRSNNNSANEGSVEITAANDITTNTITTSGQPINLTSNNGRIDTTAGTLDSRSDNNRGGDINLNAATNLNLGNLNSSTTSNSPDSQAGTINLNAGNNNNTITLAGDINTSATTGQGSDLNFNHSVQLFQPTTTITTSGNNNSGNILFNNPINGINAGENSLILNAGSGNITLRNIGEATPLSNLDVNTTGITTLNGNLTLNNSIDFTEAVGGTTLLTDVSINTRVGNGDIRFNNSPINGAGQRLFLDAGTGEISLGRVGGNNGNQLRSIIFNQASTLNLLGDIYTGGGLDFSTVQTVNVAFDTITLDTTVDNGTIDFTGSNLNGPGFLTLNTGNNNVILDTVNPANPLEGLGINARTVTSNGNLTVGTRGIAINATDSVILNNSLNSSGEVEIFATQNLNTRDITATGNITLTTTNGNLNTGTLNTRSNTGISNNILLQSNTGSVTTENLISSGITAGGNITVNTETAITTAQINTTATQGNGGNVSLDPTGNVQVEFINTEGGTQGRGGNIFIESTNGFFQATGTFSTQFSPTGTASLSSAGGLGGGSINIRHAGGPLNPPISPFDLGQPLAENGVVAAITTGEFTLTSPNSFPQSFRLGNITIQTDDAPPSFLNDPLIQGEVGIELNQNVSLPPNQLETDSVTLQPDQQAYLSSAEEPPLLSAIDFAFDTNNIDSSILLLEQLRTREFQQYLGVSGELLSRNRIQQLLKELEEQTEQIYAVVYVVVREQGLELIVLPSNGSPQRYQVSEATQKRLLPVVREFQIEITNPRRRDTNSYQKSAQQLYQWIMKPIENDLQQLGVSTILFSLDSGLRSLPLAALMDGDRFLIENYSLSIIPSTSLVDFRYASIQDAEVLAMGASQFQEQNPLPAVPVELTEITQLWQGEAFLNNLFTLDNLKNQRQRFDFEVIHLATHADFKPGSPDRSYIQLWNEKLPLTQLPTLNWDNPPVELLVLSACRTALGDRQAELGFAGLAVQAGVKSALASLWYVSDAGTLGLMTEFYTDLKTAPIKAVALQQAQLAILQGKIKIENGQLITEAGAVPLPPALANQEIGSLSHPYFWAGFTLIGSPW